MNTTNSQPDINPATGLPLIDDSYIDVGGNPYGTTLNPSPWPQSQDHYSYDVPLAGFDPW